MFLPDSADLFTDRSAYVDIVQPWKPESLTREQWPPNYVAVYAWRLKTLEALRADPDLLTSAMAYYSNHPKEFIMHWMDTYNPRKSVKWVPFVFFSVQDDFIDFLHELRLTGESGLVEKSRDMGATWQACGYSVWSWLFIPDDAIGWGSRKQDLVDEPGNPDSIFEKMRLLVRRLPDVFKPEGLSERKHMTFQKMLNPVNGAIISGEAGDNIGRGGRKSIYFKDESAHYERAEKIEAALGDNTNVQVDISSVNGLGNVFHRRREAGVEWQRGKIIDPGYTRVMVIDWSDHPEKTREWYETRKAKYEREGLLHLFAQEVDRNYSAAVLNTIIAYEWIEAAVDAHLTIPCLRVPPPDVWMAGLDVADGGLDTNALALRQWVILRNVEEWSERDPGVTTRRALAAVRDRKGIKIQADLIGVGSGVKTEYNRLIDDGIITWRDAQLVFWNAGAGVANPFENTVPGDHESPMNKDVYGNFKAQAWWSIRTRFYKTFKMIQAIKAGEPVPDYSGDELISLDSQMPSGLLKKVMKELAQPTRAESTGMRTIVDKKPNGTKSPNTADAVIQSFFPVPDAGGQALSGSYSG